MAAYVRKIRTEENIQIFRASDILDSLYADVVTELNISDRGDLSVWKVDNPDDPNELEQALICISVSCMNKCEDIQFIIIYDEDLRAHNLPLPEQQPEEIGVQESLQNKHHNLKGLLVNNLSDCLKLYHDIIMEEDFNNHRKVIYKHGYEIAELLLRNKKNNIINADCNTNLFGNIRKKYQKIYNEIMLSPE